MSIDTAEKPVSIGDIGTGRMTRALTERSIGTLAASMAVEGQRHPVLLVPSGDILDGGRRLAAARELGWATIATRYVTTVEDAVESIIEAKDEHTLPRSTVEYVDLGMMIETLDHRDPGIHDYIQLVGSAVASSGSSYKRARYIVQASRSKKRPRHVVDVAVEALLSLDAGVPTTTAYNRVRAAEKDDTQVDDTIPADDLPPIPPPSPLARSTKARQLRETWIRALNAKGATSEQIAQKLGISVGGLRKICKEIGLDIQADQALSKFHRRAADPNRAMRVAMDDLDALVWSLDRVNVLALDPEEAHEWSLMLIRYARSLNRASRKIRGVLA